MGLGSGRSYNRSPELHRAASLDANACCAIGGSQNWLPHCTAAGHDGVSSASSDPANAMDDRHFWCAVLSHRAPPAAGALLAAPTTLAGSLAA